MSAELHQLSLSYSSEEDRLLLVISTRKQDEYRIWLSRRFTSMLLGVIRQIVDDFGGMQDQTVSQDVQDMFRSGAFEQPLQPHSGSLPFGDDGILAYGIKTEQINEDQYAIELFSKEQKNVSFGFDKANMIMFQDMLQQSLLKTDWNLAEMIPVGEAIH